LVDDASSDGVIDEGSEGEHDGSRAHFFSRTLGDGWVEVEPGIYLERGEFSELTTTPEREETLDDALSGALRQEDAEPDAEHDDASGRLRRWLHR
jgi:hypothetical protein